MIDGLEFTWDEDKNRTNQAKHGSTFEEALTAFADENGLVIDDPDHSDDEERFVLLGFSSTLRLLVVCHCYRQKNEIRIISARKAGRAERQNYFGRHTR